VEHVERRFSSTSDAGRVSETMHGGCLCGTVRFAISPPYRWFSHCHCSMCRKHHGSLFGTGLGVRRESFRWLEGANEIVHYRATAAFERPFCRRCGSTVPAVSQDERYWNVPAGLLDADPGARPRTHIFAASRSPLTELDDELPRHDDYPPGFTLPTAPVRAPQEVAAVGGSCLCGAVVFTASVAPQRLVNCYCSLCRRSRAAAFGSTLLVPGESFRFTRGAHHVRSYALPAAATAMDGGSAANAGAICARRYATDFCGECGSPAPISAPHAPVAMLPAGAIDTPLAPLPTMHLYVASKAPWYEITAAGEQFDELPPPAALTALLR
jgi:hypothetical protein